ncbi:MAG: nitroreductase [Hymenobacteraceae bacterium]|nr:nitroreductase [Hymenobacteraceae bacterium]MDX5397712.1 nitroreductase [Hymenobacteraceae bacterium]MDX5513790.1 nitroreductase [Hymenobacteraceae bacterium]
MNDRFKIVKEVIEMRRSVKPVQMNGQRIMDEQVKELLQLADWAPTHGYTEPWRFIVFSRPQDFCSKHAELYKENTPESDFQQLNYEKYLHMGDKASHVVVAVMQRGNLAKIPVLEEVAATASAIQNILLGATAAGIASFWSTGGLTYHQALKDWLQLREEDQVMGLIYLGYSDKPASTGRRNINLEEKIDWR